MIKPIITISMATSKVNTLSFNALRARSAEGRVAGQKNYTISNRSNLGPLRPLPTATTIQLKDIEVHAILAEPVLKQATLVDQKQLIRRVEQVHLEAISVQMWLRDSGN